MTTRTPKLSDMQLILLAIACQRDDGSLLPPPDSIGAQADRIRKAVAGLIKRKLAQEVDVTDLTRTWREDGDRQLGVVITDAGRAIIAAKETEALSETDATKASAVPPKPPVPPTTKIGMVLDLLRREQGASLTELTSATGWLPHTTRAALTGLRQKPCAR